jgi:TolB-like protein
MKKLYISIILIAITALTGCQNIQLKNHNAAEGIHHQIKIKNIPVEVIAVTTLTNIQKMGNATGEAQISSEILASKLSQLGYQVIEVKLSGSMNIEPNGEFILSRSIENLPKNINVTHLLVGTYMDKGSRMLINTKLVDINTRLIVASYTYNIHDYTLDL